MSAGRKVLVGLLLAVAAAAVVVLLFTVVFPWFDRTFFADPVVGLAGTAPQAATGAHVVVAVQV